MTYSLLAKSLLAGILQGNAQGVSLAVQLLTPFIHHLNKFQRWVAILNSSAFTRIASDDMYTYVSRARPAVVSFSRVQGVLAISPEAMDGSSVTNIHIICR